MNPFLPGRGETAAKKSCVVGEDFPLAA